MLWLLFALAQAHPGGGVFFPTAMPREAGEGAFGGGVGFRTGDQGLAIITGQLEGEVAAGSGFVFSGQLRSGPVFAQDGPYPIAMGLLFARWQAVNGDGFRLAPWVGFGGLVPGDQDVFSDIEPLLAASTGIALEAGGEHVRFDLSTPLLGITQSGTRPIVIPPWFGGLISDIGLSVVAGDHRVRLGTMGAWFPQVSWTWTAGDRYLGATVSYGIVEGFALGGGVHAGTTF